MAQVSKSLCLLAHQYGVLRGTMYSASKLLKIMTQENNSSEF